MNKLIRPKDVIPLTTLLIAARTLQKDAPLGGRHSRAIDRMANMAERGYHRETIGVLEMARAKTAYRRSKYWHGTGRYQWKDGKQSDVLTGILDAAMLLPGLDKFDTSAGTKLVRTTSLSAVRLYARCYADMHHNDPDSLNRYLNAQYAVGFFVVRPYVRHMIQDAQSHSGGLLQGFRQQRRLNAARQSQLPQLWTAKIRKHSVNPMLAFRAGSDIPDNYGILFGIDEAVGTGNAHQAFAETREKRTAEPITLDHITHIEVPRNRVAEVTGLLKEHKADIPVVATEAVEALVADLPMSEVLGL